MTEASYEDLVGMLTDFNVALTDVNGEYRSTYDIMADIAAQWGNMTSMEQAALATAMSGTRQQAVFYSIINQFQEASGAMDAMSNSAGELERSYSTYMESATAHINQFKSTYQELAQNLVDSGTVSAIVDIGTALLKLLNTLARFNQLLPAILVSITAIRGISIVRNIEQIKERMAVLATSILQQGTYNNVLGMSVANLTAKERELLAAQIARLASAHGLTEAEQAQILTAYGLTAADASLATANKGLAASFKSLLASIGPLGWLSITISGIIEVVSLLSLVTNDTAESAEDSIESIEQRLEETQNSIQSTADELRQLNDTARDVIPKFANLAHGVNEFGENVGLTDEQYAEFLELNNQIAEMFPELNMGMNDSGNAMLALSYTSDTLSKSLLALVDAQRKLANQEIAEGLEDEVKNIVAATDALHDQYLAEFDKTTAANDYIPSLYSSGSHTYETDFWSGEWLGRAHDRVLADSSKLDEMGIKYHINNLITEWGNGISLGGVPYGYELVIDSSMEEFKARCEMYANQAENEINKINDRIAATWNRAIPSFRAWMDTDYLFSDLPDTMQSVADAMLSGLDLQSLGLKTDKEIKNYISDNIILPLYDSGPEVRSAFSQITDWESQLQSGEMSIEEFNSNVKGAFDQLFESMAPSEVNSFKNMFVDGFNTMGVAGGSFDEVLNELIRSWGKFDSLSKSTSNLSNLKETTESMQKALDLLDSATNEMRNGGGISADTIQSLADMEENYLDYLYEENGVVKLNTEAWERRSKATLESDIAQLRAEIARLEVDRKTLEGALANPGDGNAEMVADYTQRLEENTANIEKNQDLLKLYTAIYDGLTSSLDDTNSALSGLSDTLSNLESAYKIVNSAEEEMANGGGLSVSTIQALAKETDNYLDYLYEENGAIKLNTEAWEEFAQEDIKSRIAELETELAGLQERASSPVVRRWNPDAFKDEIAETSRELEILRLIMQYYTDTANEAAVAQSEFTKALSQLQGLESGFSLLDKIYADISDGDTFDWSAILNNEQFAEAFGYLGDAYTDFIETVANSPSDIASCQEAFDRLTTEYILQSGALDSVTDQTRDATVAMLEQMGVANAAAIVDQKLAYNKEYLKFTTGEYADLSEYELRAMYQECDAGSLLQQVIARVAAEKALFNKNGIRTESDIDQLIGLANAARATQASIQNLRRAKSLAQTIDAYEEQAEKQKALGNTKTYEYYMGWIQQRREQLEKLLSEGLDFEDLDPDYFKATYVGGSEYQKSQESGSSSSSKEETWFEKQYKLHQHLVAMEQETDIDYLAWLNGAYQKAYSEGILGLDEYRKYQEEVYKGLQSLFKDYLGDVEHEISMRESFDGENKKIVSLYKELISAVEKEIKSARASGLTDNDDYIQELQDSWVKYRDAIKEIEDSVKDNAKSALENLVDLRVDMIKQELDDEKDAIDKRLDYLKDFYQKQKDLLQDAYDEEKYLEEQSEKRKAVSDIQAQIAQLEYDNSAWAQKRKLELAEELADAQKELSDFERDHALDNAQSELDRLYEMQEKELEAQKDLLDQSQNDARSLYVQALEDIKNGSISLYEEMVEWNSMYGDGIEDTIKNAWEEAYKALKEYKDLYGSLYEDVNLQNATGYKENNGAWNDATISGASKTAAPSSGGASSVADDHTTSSSKTLGVGSTVTVKKSATNYGAGSNYKKMASFVPGSTFTVYKTNDDEVLIGLNGEYTGWVKKSDIVGYSGGTSKASHGLHRIDERGIETIFESADGSKYKMFTGNEKVLNAQASDFLFKFANGGEALIDKLFGRYLKSDLIDRQMPAVNSNSITMGDIIIHGSADKQTVSEIRRAQRDALSDMLKNINKLNK